MTDPLSAETIAELEEYARAVQQPEDPCMRCGQQMHVEPGDATTPLCHDCAHWVLEEYLPTLLAAARRVAELPDVGEPRVEPEFLTWHVPGVASVELYLPASRMPISVFGHVMNAEQARRVAAALLAAARSSEAEGGGR